MKEKQYVRFLDDWAYQANARMAVYQKLIWPQSWPNSGLRDKKLVAAEKNVSQEIINVAEPLMGKEINNYKFTAVNDKEYDIIFKENSLNNFV